MKDHWLFFILTKKYRTGALIPPASPFTGPFVL